MATKYANTDANTISSSATHVRVTLTSGTGQGAGGTETVCKGCLVQPILGNTAVVRVNIDVDASDTVGIDLPFTSATVQCAPTFIPIDDVAKLYFYSTDTDAVIDIIYFRG
jgi:hypothetical protein